ncbi:exodeoxyribonuclease VII large subunit [Shewanella sp. OPT22]|nr:exodeoxyribonuclease VII large subunit [Shewanella sp. OPT22]
MTKTIYTVSRLNGEVRRTLEGQIGRVWLSAEVSNFSSPSSGHWYLTLKDHFSQIRCAMFKGKNRNVSFRPANGQQVLVQGNISVYEPRGDYQLIIDSMQPAGDGLLAQQFETLKLKLAADGLFSAEDKRPLPDSIQKIGVITSPTGAAIRDILHVLNRRDPSIEVIIYPAQVQGEYATQLLCNAINLANGRDEVDVLLVTRGGGSLEDLWCFNEEALAHTIYNSGLPVVSAVGHEVDTTISDYVADVRAPTPSAGAELLSKDVSHKSEKITTLSNRLIHAFKHYNLQKSAVLNHLQAQLQKHEPENKLIQLQQRFDEAQLKLDALIQQKLHHAQLKQQNLQNRLLNLSPKHKVELSLSQLEKLDIALKDSMTSKVTQAQSTFSHLAQQLDIVSPLATLSRGYSITTDENNDVVTDSSKLEVGGHILTRLDNGKVTSKIEKIEH